ncbi:MAG: hypothetical protein KC550_01335 [Nanoarchaeota archaeon]|nr:hypothetical protein [Nanoarchaeota archaeon]
MKIKILSLLLVFLASIFFVNAAESGEGIFIANCETSQVKNNAKFGDLNLVPCGSLPEIKEYAKPVSVKPEIRKVTRMKKEIVVAEAHPSLNVVSNNVRFGEKSICKDDCVIEYQGFNKPVSVEPKHLSVKILNFVKKCFA